MGVIGWIVVGFVAGAFAARSPVPAAGSAASARSSWGSSAGCSAARCFNLAGAGGIGDFGFRSMFVAFIGATLLLIVVGWLTGDRPGNRGTGGAPRAARHGSRVPQARATR